MLPGERIFLVTNGERGPVRLDHYPEPLRPGIEVELELVRESAAEADRRGDKVTAADASAGGETVAIRSYDERFLYDARDLLQEGGCGAARPLRPPAAGGGAGRGRSVRGRRGDRAGPLPWCRTHGGVSRSMAHPA